MILAYAIIIGQQLIPLLLAILGAFFITRKTTNGPSARSRMAAWVVILYVVFWVLLILAVRLVFAHFWAGSD